MMSSSQCIVPKWNLRQQRQEEEGEERKRSSHVQPHQNLTNYVVPMCEDEVRELRWEKGQVGVHGMNELNQRWGGGGGGDHTLESIVHQATSSAYSAKSQQHQYAMGIKCMDENSGQVQAEQSGSKRVRSDGGGFPAEECRSRSGSATFFRDRDTDQMTWNSFDSSRSLKTARTNDHSLYHHCQENEDGGTAKEESCRSESSARRSRAAAIHNLSERRRRDRINEKMKALQKLVPNASKTDKASMLEEVIEYLKQLQAQVQMMSNASRNMMMQPLGMQAQQQLQMSLMAARMGMGMGMGMAIPPPILNPPFLPQPFSIKPMVDAHAAAAAAATISNDAYNAFLAQSMNMEFLNKMSALYKQQSSSSQQPSAKPVGLSLPNHDAQGG